MTHETSTGMSIKITYSLEWQNSWDFQLPLPTLKRNTKELNAEIYINLKNQYVFKNINSATRRKK